MRDAAQRSERRELTTHHLGPHPASKLRSHFALLKTSPRPPENHEIVREHAEHELACLREQAPRAERRAEAALVPTEDALGVPALVVERPRKLPPQGAPIRRCGPPAGGP